MLKFINQQFIGTILVSELMLFWTGIIGFFYGYYYHVDLVLKSTGTFTFLYSSIYGTSCFGDVR